MNDSTNVCGIETAGPRTASITVDTWALSRAAAANHVGDVKLQMQQF
jgi:hypothetical protein